MIHFILILVYTYACTLQSLIRETVHVITAYKLCSFYNLFWLFMIEWVGITTVVGSFFFLMVWKTKSQFPHVHYKTKWNKGRTKTHLCNVHCIYENFMFFLSSKNHVIRIGWNCYLNITCIMIKIILLYCVIMFPRKKTPL